MSFLNKKSSHRIAIAIVSLILRHCTDLKQIRPAYITLFIAGILALLFAISWFVPENGWSFAGNQWKFLTFEKIIRPVKQEKADIKEIVADVDTSMTEDPMLQHINGSNSDFGAPSGGDIQENASTELLMSESGKANLHSFFAKLDSVAANKKKISILHYGDSQIEGDRMTGFIRQRIQNQFGGFGPGLIPATNVYFNHIDFNEGMAVSSVLQNPALGQHTYYAQSYRTRGLVKIPGLSSIPENAIVHTATLELPVQYQSGQPFEPGTELSVALFKSATDSTLISDGSTIGLFNAGNKTFTINLRNYVQRIVSGELENTGFVVSPLLFSNTMDRIIFNGPETDKKLKPSFKITFSEF